MTVDDEQLDAFEGEGEGGDGDTGTEWERRAPDAVAVDRVDAESSGRLTWAMSSDGGMLAVSVADMSRLDEDLRTVEDDWDDLPPLLEEDDEDVSDDFMLVDLPPILSDDRWLLELLDDRAPLVEPEDDRALETVGDGPAAGGAIFKSAA